MMRNSELASSDITVFVLNDTQKQAQEKEIFHLSRLAAFQKKTSGICLKENSQDQDNDNRIENNLNIILID